MTTRTMTLDCRYGKRSSDRNFSLFHIHQQIAQCDDSLDLTTFKRCIVNNIECRPSTFEKIIFVRDKKSQKTARCCLSGPWFDTMVSTGDVVSLQATWSNDRGMFMVSSSEGFVVTHPDTLVSGTTVVGSLFCARKSALTERFRQIDSGDKKIVNIH